MKFRAVLCAVLLGVSGHGQAAPSDTECSIWLCVFQPYEPACAAAMAASAKLLLQGEPSPPPFSECDSNGDDHGLEVQTGIAARIGDEEPMRFSLGRECVVAENATISGTTSPRGCTATYRLTRILQHGVQVGEIQVQRIRGVAR